MLDVSAKAGPGPYNRQSIAVAERRLSASQRLLANSFARKSFLLVVLALVWEGYAIHLANPLLFPRFSDAAMAFYDGAKSGVLLERAWASLRLLVQGYVIGILLTAALATLAITTRAGRDILEMMVAMFNPLPAIALLPLSLIWFGLGEASIVFVIVHSVLWAVALNTHSGFMAVSNTLQMVGRNYGLRGPIFVLKILIPAASASILTGLKLGWAFAWRTLIAAELVFGVASGGGGLGWFIYESKNQLEIPSVFAGLLSVILIGLFVENGIFRSIEARTTRRWGMQN